MKKAIERFIFTNDDAGLLIARAMLGIVMIPHGAQKLLGLFGGAGFGASMGYFTSTGIPAPVAFLVIMAESLGALALVLGFFRPVHGVRHRPGHAGSDTDRSSAPWLFHELVRGSGRGGFRISSAGHRAVAGDHHRRERKAFNGPVASRIDAEVMFSFAVPGVGGRFRECAERVRDVIRTGSIVSSGVFPRSGSKSRNDRGRRFRSGPRR